MAQQAWETPVARPVLESLGGLLCKLHGFPSGPARLALLAFGHVQRVARFLEFSPVPLPKGLVRGEGLGPLGSSRASMGVKLAEPPQLADGLHVLANAIRREAAGLHV